MLGVSLPLCHKAGYAPYIGTENPPDTWTPAPPSAHQWRGRVTFDPPTGTRQGKEGGRRWGLQPRDMEQVGPQGLAPPLPHALPCWPVCPAWSKMPSTDSDPTRPLGARAPGLEAPVPCTGRRAPQCLDLVWLPSVRSPSPPTPPPIWECPGLWHRIPRFLNKLIGPEGACRSCCLLHPLMQKTDVRRLSGRFQRCYFNGQFF